MRSLAKPAALENHTGFWLRFVSNHVSHGFARKVAGSGVTVAEWVDPPADLRSRRNLTRPDCRFERTNAWGGIETR